MKVSTPIRLAGLQLGLFVILSTLSRVALAIASAHELKCDGGLLGAFLVGFGFDLATGMVACLPWLLVSSLMPNSWYESKVVKWVTMVGMTVAMGLMIFISTAEWFFWDEFGARFNFIAVDYLVWTQEVWGNITESYPIPAIFSGIAVVAGLIVYGLVRMGALRWVYQAGASLVERFWGMWVGVSVVGLVIGFVSQAWVPSYRNAYCGELAKNGCWSFFHAFRHMELDYERWYVKMPIEEALAQVRAKLARPNEVYGTEDRHQLQRQVVVKGQEKRWNVILVCMESMSGSFMSYVGNKDGLTPNLDRLAKESIFFENLYATGTRTVRGMEALTLNLPPTPGQAIIYRPQGVDLVTSFTPFLERGYDCGFFYGGDGRFDYMNRYFSTAGAKIMDVNAWQKGDVTMKTSWGACDEDLYHKTIADADANYAAGKPFHYFCMTTSNHRPYDFPNGRIDMPSHSGRKAAVKYSDWAVGEFLELAAKKPWFKDTLFVFVSDHCASSAGKVEIDVTKYRIPAMIYNPSLVGNKTVGLLSSQVDVMPTVFGLLGWGVKTTSYGHDVLAPEAATLEGRAFVSNYQKVGLLKEDKLAILKPNSKVSTYQCDRMSGDVKGLDAAQGEELVKEAAVYYQSAAWLFGSGQLKRKEK